MTRLTEAEREAVCSLLSPTEPQIAQSDVVHCIEDMQDEIPDECIPLLVPEGSNKAAFNRIGEEVQELHKEKHNGLADVNLYNFWIDCWKVYTKQYGNGSEIAEKLPVTE